MRFSAVISGVIFDMDGTLVETERLASEAALFAMRQLGFAERPDVLAELIGTVGQDTAVFTRAFGPSFDPAAFERIWRAQLEASYAKGIALRPGVVALLDRLDHLNLPFALASNARTLHARRTLKLAGIANRFAPRHVHGRDRVALPKPAPDLYLHAAAGLGVDPALCVAFEDSDAGARAALAAGMTVVHVPDLQPLNPQIAVQVRASSLLEGARVLGLLE